ncbi:hypothetical protein BC941DRAFT_476107 [Chlamydoabsidia padenii]|nr:hypothetical protein BC941DRAFT_476107 [Chlamydoabsidia padenii]
MKKKKEQTNINAIEGYLSEIEQVHKNQDDHTMFTLGPYMKKQNHGTERFNGKAYASVAKALIRNPVDLKLKARQVKPVVFYGDAGQGHGSRIKGYQRRSTTKLQQSLKEKATVHETNKYLTSKLGCLCNSRVAHLRRRDSTKLNSGIMVCINSDCIGFSLRGRDQNAAINILKKGIYKMATNIDYPVFTSSSATTATAQILFKYLIGGDNSWKENMSHYLP